MKRTLNETIKIGKGVTGLKSAVFVHVGRSEDGTLTDIRFSSAWKDGSTMDNLLTALGDAVTEEIAK